MTALAAPAARRRLVAGKRRASRARSMPTCARSPRRSQIEPLLDASRRSCRAASASASRSAAPWCAIPKVFLMDEPLSNLDAKLRVHMRTELAELHRRLGATFIYVTHDQVRGDDDVGSRRRMMDGESCRSARRPRSTTIPRDCASREFIGSPGINVLPGVVASRGRSRCSTGRCRSLAGAPVGSRGAPGHAARMPDAGQCRCGSDVSAAGPAGRESRLRLLRACRGRRRRLPPVVARADGRRADDFVIGAAASASACDRSASFVRRSGRAHRRTTRDGALRHG